MSVECPRDRWMLLVYSCERFSQIFKKKLTGTSHHPPQASLTSRNIMKIVWFIPKWWNVVRKFGARHEFGLQNIAFVEEHNHVRIFQQGIWDDRSPEKYRILLHNGMKIYCSQNRTLLTSRLTVSSSDKTWSKQLIGAKKIIASMSSKNGTQAAAKKALYHLLVKNGKRSTPLSKTEG
jgi:hypothetical protein